MPHSSSLYICTLDEASIIVGSVREEWKKNYIIRKSSSINIRILVGWFGWLVGRCRSVRWSRKHTDLLFFFLKRFWNRNQNKLNVFSTRENDTWIQQRELFMYWISAASAYVCACVCMSVQLDYDLSSFKLMAAGNKYMNKSNTRAYTQTNETVKWA